MAMSELSVLGFKDRPISPEKQYPISFSNMVSYINENEVCGKHGRNCSAVFRKAPKLEKKC